MASATEHLLADVWAQGGVRDVYADFNELTLNITTNALFGVDMSSSQAAGISGKHSGHPPLHNRILSIMPNDVKIFQDVQIHQCICMDTRVI